MNALDLWTRYRLDNKAAEKQAAEQEASIRRALALQAFGGQPGTQDLNPLAPVPGLQGVTDTTPPLAGLQQELANDRLEQQRQTALPDVTQLAQSVALARAGLDPSKMAAARTEALRGNLLADNVPGLSPEAQINAANRRDVAPVRYEGGVFYKPFNQNEPLIGMSPVGAADFEQKSAAARLGDARTGLTNAQQQEANRRLQALQEALDQTAGNPLLSADIANRKATYKPQRVKVKEDGVDVYYDALPKPGGGFDYRRATGPDGKPVAVPVSESGAGGTALQKDTAFISQVLNLPAQEAIRYKLESRGKGDQALRDDVSLRLLSDPRMGRLATTDPAKFNAQVDAVFKVLRPGQAAVPPDAALPAPAAAAPAPAPAPARPAAQAAPAVPTGSGQDDPRYEEARAAVARGADLTKVRQRLQSMGLDPNRM